MALEAGKDYVYAPKTNRLGPGGVQWAVLVGTRRYLFVIPHESIGGAGRTIETRTYTLAGGDPRQTVPELLAVEGLTVEDLEKALCGIVEEIDGEALDIATFGRFKIDVGSGLFGWLKNGLYYKIDASKRMWSAVAVRGKEDRQNLYNFYVDQLHPDSPSPLASGT